MLSLVSNKKILLFLGSVFLIFLFVGAEKSLAQHDSGVGWYKYYGGDLEKFEEDVFGTEQFNQPSHAYSNLENLTFTGVNMIVGCITDDCRRSLTSTSGGAVGFFASRMEDIYLNKPASAAFYFADLGQRFNIAQPAYAQGIGFSGLSVLLPLWRHTRNIAYTFFTIVLIITGFAIMFRAKINPQTVVTIQSAIPRVIMALVLVTFSYAIVGLVIDLMYLLIAIIVNIFQASGIVTLGPDPFRKYTGMSFWGLIGEIFGTGIGAFGGLLQVSVIQAVITGLAALFAGPMGAAISALPALIIALIFLFAVFGVFFSLLLAYIKIIVSLLIAPLQLMISVLPGQNTFSSWLKNLISSALAFPTVIAMLLLAKTLAENTTRGVWAPPIISSDAQAGGIVGGILALGVLLMTPKAVDIIKGVFEGQAFQYGTALKGAIVGPPATVAGWGEGIAKSSQGGLLGSVKSKAKVGGVWGAHRAHRARLAEETSQAEKLEEEKRQQVENAQRISGRGIPEATKRAAKRSRRLYPKQS